jgi:hypothetical protein
LTQAVTPWGIRAVKSLPADQLGNLPTEMTKVTPPSGMYGVFNNQVAALVAVKPSAYYNMGRYFAVEFVTQVLAGIVLTLILALTNSLPLTEQLVLVGLVGLLGQISIDLQYWNWWGFSSAYTFGFTVNRLVGYLIVGFVVGNWIIV